MVDVCVETEIRDLSPKSFVSLPKEYWDNKKTTQAIFQAISAASDPLVKLEQVTYYYNFLFVLRLALRLHLSNQSK